MDTKSRVKLMQPQDAWLLHHDVYLQFDEMIGRAMVVCQLTLPLRGSNCGVLQSRFTSANVPDQLF